MKIILPAQLKPDYGITFCNEHRRRLEAKNLFPRRVRLAPNGDAYGYVPAELDEYIAARVADRDDLEPEADA